MRALMHHPAFQQLESLWRGVFRLVRHVDTDERLQVYIVDVSRDALRADLMNSKDVRQSALFRTLESRAPSDEGGWGALVCHHTLGADENDLALLAQLASLGAVLDAPWLAEAHQDLAMGALADPARDAWTKLRASNIARYLGLAMPRVLLRLPYGADTEEIERFTFEELEGDAPHSSYLWGNPAVFCATLLAQGFTENGPGLSAGGSSQIDGLPLHLVKRGGETVTKPCAEVVMREEDALALLEAGFIPMCGLRDQDVVRVPRIQSVTAPTSRLSGRLSH
jgi:type VI secretion system protein ImpC